MAIRARTIEVHGEKQVVVMGGHRQIGDAMERFFEREYAAREAYLVVCGADGRVGVMLFKELLEIRALVGADQMGVPLAEWPIRPASGVFLSENTESGLEIVEWVERHPGSRVVVVDKQGAFVCLFSNPNRSRSIFGSSLPRLHGLPASLRDDWRRKAQSVVEKPICPYCQHQDFYTIQDRALVCQKCEEKVKAL